MLRRSSLPMPQHALMQKRIGPQQRLIKASRWQAQTRMRPLQHLDANATQPLPGSLLRRQANTDKHLGRRPPQASGNVAHQRQGRRIKAEKMRLPASTAQVQAGLPVTLLQFRHHIVGHPRQEISEARQARAQGGGGVQQDVQPPQRGGRHTIDQFTAKRHPRARTLAFVPQALDQVRRHVQILPFEQ
ncbi:hypothetical protein D3C80_866580 [compost metagenome]